MHKLGPVACDGWISGTNPLPHANGIAHAFAVTTVSPFVFSLARHSTVRASAVLLGTLLLVALLSAAGAAALVPRRMMLEDVTTLHNMHARTSATSSMVKTR
jgi:amino acid permease